MAEIKNVSVPVYNQAGEKVSTLSLKGGVFNVEVNEVVMRDAVKVYLANKRQNIAKTKKRHEVRGGGRKPWRQKGTGRARAGSRRSPIWVGGGVVFGPTGDENYKLKQNKKEHRLALKSALTLKVKNGLKVVDVLVLEETKTKSFVELLNALSLKGKTLLVLNEFSEQIALSARNLKDVYLTTPDNVSVYDLLDSEHVLMSKDAIKSLEEALI